MNWMHRIIRGIGLRLQNIFILRDAKSEINKKQYLKGGEYDAYIQNQLTHTIGLRTKDAAFRYNKFITTFLEKVPGVDRSSKVLCVGCRNVHELDAFRDAGFKNIVGVDLFSTNPQILVMDMHDLKFDNDSFDILYSAATFEKAYDPQRVANEFLRVVKSSGYIILEVGAHYKTGEVDRHDFENLPNLYQFFKSSMGSIFYEADTEDSLVTIFQVQKSTAKSFSDTHP